MPQLCVHLMGHLYLSLESEPLELSGKGAALLVYLALEKRPQHREHMASLLWGGAESRGNLRVELARLRGVGLELTPSSARLLTLSKCRTDLELWESWAEVGVGARDLGEWLGMVRGLPLSGLEDLGSPEFQDWVYHQANVLTERIGKTLEKVYHDLEKGKLASEAALVRVRAESLGLHFSSPPTREPSRVHLPRREVETTLKRALEHSRTQPLLVSLRGPAGSGKTYLSDWLCEYASGPCVKVASLRSSRLALASTAMQLKACAHSGQHQTLQALLTRPGSLEEDWVRLLEVMREMTTPLVLVFEHAQTAADEFGSLLEFLLGNLFSGLVVLTSREDRQPSALVRSLLRRLPPRAYQNLRLESLRLDAVLEVLEPPPSPVDSPPGSPPVPGPEALPGWGEALGYANRLLQRSEGNAAHLLALLDDPSDLEHSALPRRVLEVYQGEAQGWPAELFEAMRYLSVIHAAFDEGLALELLRAMGHSEGRLWLSQALEKGILHPLEGQRRLSFPFGSSSAAHGTPHESSPTSFDERFEFRREGLRVALNSSLPQPLRREVRRHLIGLTEASDPGLAAFYARRTGDGSQFNRLLERYLCALPPGSPLRERTPSASQGQATPRAVPTPPQTDAELTPERERGFELSLERGWLGLRRRGCYGHAETLRLHFALPILSERGVERSGDLKLVWRLDEFSGGYDTLPCEVPYPLAARLTRSGDAHLLSLEPFSPFLEGELRLRPIREPVHQFGWMEHRLPLCALEGETLELSVRALDVALLIGQLEWCGHSLLSVPSPHSHPSVLHARPFLAARAGIFPA